MKQLLLPFILLAAAYCQAAPILPEEAKEHVGENVSVRGLVEQVSVSKKGHAFLNFGQRTTQTRSSLASCPATSCLQLGGDKGGLFPPPRSSGPLRTDWQRHVLASSGYLELGMFDDAAMVLEAIAPEDKTRKRGRWRPR